MDWPAWARQAAAAEMARISIEESHSLGSAEAQRRIEAYVDELAHGAFPGVTIENVQNRWEGSRLETSFKARKGFFSKQVSGAMDVGDAAVRLEVDVPDLVFSFVPREQVESVVREKLREKLA